MDWFERLTGFPEGDYATTVQNLQVEGEHLHSTINGKSYRTGRLELASLKTLRDRVSQAIRSPGRLRVSAVVGDVRRMHQAPENSTALFQVASQFNLLEMASPKFTPNDGVGCYEHDRTQGPACAIAAGAATIYRNYFVPVDGQIGQTAERQINCLHDVGVTLTGILGLPLEKLWALRNGYALCSELGLDAISECLQSLSLEKIDEIRGDLKVGVHSDVEVTDSRTKIRPVVSQVFCSALPVAYTRIPSERWAPFASLVLEAAYEATLLAAILNHANGNSSVVLLTHLGGGAFGNNPEWITRAIRRALVAVSDFDLDVKIVSFSRITTDTAELVNEFR
ncbi:hypothetical protein [Bradyrhizobium betae]|uniref:Macro domain-containing protein n=1 Tax=Bradyrhizobium betae TaxID=244734 RepID=A0A5P6P6Q9_9BRAD|nr:hypothetical protein [Bradyrhizobium betae]MCS3731378.1 hypothetical protein [Bradyrhizobium betae]QFI73970.1 hypothetical protein F8237_17085 [Bradyrhizobium betae]